MDNEVNSNSKTMTRMIDYITGTGYSDGRYAARFALFLEIQGT